MRRNFLRVSKRLHRFRLVDLILVPLVGVLALLILGFTVVSFITTLAPNPTWPALITTLLTLSGASRDYWRVSQLLWELPD